MENQPKLSTPQSELKKIWKTPSIEIISHDSIRSGTFSAPEGQHIVISGSVYIGGTS